MREDHQGGAKRREKHTQQHFQSRRRKTAAWPTSTAEARDQGEKWRRKRQAEEDVTNSSGAKTLRAFAAEAWEGLAEASGGGRALARTRPGVPGGRDRVVSGSLSSQLWGVNQASRRRWT